MARILALCAAITTIVLVVGCGSSEPLQGSTGVNYVFVNDPASLFHLYEVMGTSVTQLTSGTGANQETPCVSWDRTKCVYADESGGTSRIAVVNLPGGNPQYLTNPTNGYADYEPAISPDGQLIAFVRGYMTGAVIPRIWIMQADGSDARPLGPGTGTELDPTFSADGRAVYYSSNAAGSFDIYRMSVINGGVTRITKDDNASEMQPTMRSSMEDLIYSSNATGSWRLYYMDATHPDTPPVQITNGPGDDTDPCWPHPGGTKILFTNHYNGVYTIKSLEVFPLQGHTAGTEQATGEPQMPSQ